MIKTFHLRKTRNRSELGALIEAQAATWLKQRGLRLIRRNYRCRLGEIDIIARDGDYLVFVEVRYRSHRAYGGAAVTVDRRKQQRLIRTAETFLLQHKKVAQQPCRFDVVAVSVNNTELIFQWHRNAFSADDSNPHAF